MVFRAPWSHLARRFVASLVGRVEAGSRSLVDDFLSDSERALFETMSSADQRHSVDLCERLRRDGFTDSDLLRAALLHDVGKGVARVSVVVRVINTLAAITSPPLADWLSASDVGWRRQFFAAAHHDQIGAAAAERAGSSPKVVSLIAGHGARGNDILSQTLYDYDRGM